jgi:hypothetical protein
MPNNNWLYGKHNGLHNPKEKKIAFMDLVARRAHIRQSADVGSSPAPATK